MLLLNINHFLCSYYQPIVNESQRSKYKEDFNTEYKEYRSLHSSIEQRLKPLNSLIERLQKELKDSPEYEVGSTHLHLTTIYDDFKFQYSVNLAFEQLQNVQPDIIVHHILSIRCKIIQMMPIEFHSFPCTNL